MFLILNLLKHKEIDHSPHSAKEQPQPHGWFMFFQIPNNQASVKDPKDENHAECYGKVQSKHDFFFLEKY